MYFLVTYRDGSGEIVELNVIDGMVVNEGNYSSRSYGYETLEELLTGEEVPNEPCKICNSQFNTRYVDHTKNQMIERNLCFTCNFWENYVGDKRRIIIDGVQYIDGGKNDTPSSWKGHSGRRFNIRMDNGKIIQTDNLWCQGEIPEHIKKHYKDKFDDNAEFIY